jgi:hypothetical protein
MPTRVSAIRLYAINGERLPFVGVADFQFDAPDY